jgi:hypothetical protein
MRYHVVACCVTCQKKRSFRGERLCVIRIRNPADSQDNAKAIFPALTKLVF